MTALGWWLTIYSKKKTKNNTKKKEAAVKLAKYLACSEKSNIMNYQLGQAIPNIEEYAENQYIQGEGLEGRQLMPANR